MVDIYGGQERRRFPRVISEFVIIYRVDRPIEVRFRIGNREINALMLDLSGGGMAILTNCDVPVSTALLIKFTLINHYADRDNRVRSMEIIGEVRNSVMSKKNEYRLGISFTRISEEDKDAITRFVNTAMSQKHRGYST